MAIDIKKLAEELVEKIKSDPQLLREFTEKPVAALEKLLGIDLPDAQIEKLAQLIKAKIDIDKAQDLLKGIGGLFQ